MAQHLAKSPVPFCNKSIGELSDLCSRRSMPRPHCWLQGLVSCVVGDELAISVRKALILHTDKKGSLLSLYLAQDQPAQVP